MKSKLFSNLDSSGIESLKTGPFKKDLEATIQLGRDNIDRLLDVIQDYIANKTTFDKEQFIDELSKSWGRDRSIVESGVDISVFFFQKTLKSGKPTDDDPEDIAADLMEMGLLKEADKSLIVRMLSRIREINASTISSDYKQRVTLSKGAPKITGLGTGVAFRAIFENEKTFGNSAEDYDAECIGLSPVISLAISTEGYDRNELRFEVEPHILEAMIEALLAAKKEMEAARKFVISTEKE